MSNRSLQEDGWWFPTWSIKSVSAKTRGETVAIHFDHWFWNKKQTRTSVTYSPNSSCATWTDEWKRGICLLNNAWLISRDYRYLKYSERSRVDNFKALHVNLWMINMDPRLFPNGSNFIFPSSLPFYGNIIHVKRQYTREKNLM